MPARPYRSDRHIKERLVACQCPEVEDHGVLLTGISAHHIGPELLRERRDRCGETAYWKVLHAEQLVDQQPDEEVVTVQHQDPTLLARGADGGTEELAQINDRQEPAADVGYTPDPGLDPRQGGIARLVKNFTDLPQRGDHGLAGQTEADAAPGFGHDLLRRQTACHAQAALRQLLEKIERMYCL